MRLLRPALLLSLLLGSAAARADEAPAPAAAAKPAPPAAAGDAAGEDASDDPLERPTGQAQKPRSLEEIKKSGYIRILTRNNSTSFFIYRGHRMGFDYEFGKRLAQQLGIRAQFVVPKEWGDLIPALLRGEGDVIASEMTITPERAKQVKFADPYLTTFEVVVWKDGAPAIKAPEDLSGKKVLARKSSAYWGTLEALNAKLKAAGKPEAELVAAPEDEETDDILDNVAHGRASAPYAVADQLIAKQTAAFLDGLEVGPAISEKRELAWAVRPEQPELAAEINSLFKKKKKEPEFNVVKRKYFEAERDIKKRGKDTIGASSGGSLSPYDPLIIKAAQKYGYDWRLVAAQIYQESRFDPHRKSWCGAQGLFQIMPATAKELGVKDPFDPKDGIEGGAKYMSKLVKHFDDVQDPVERYKMAMAGFNCGPGHVDDARRLLKDQKKPADTWKDVAEGMLLLSKEKVHGQTRYGYCRCGEPVDYVRHITERYDGYRQLVPDTAAAVEKLEKKAGKPAAKGK